MKTINDILNSMTNPEMLENLAELLRLHDPDFPDAEEKYKDAIAVLSCNYSTQVTPSFDAYLHACQTEVVANILYAGYLGYRANLENFHSPYTTPFVSMGFSDFIRDGFIGRFPICQEARSTKDRFISNLPDPLRPIASNISSYFTFLDVAGPKLAHYAGYIIANHFLPWVEPGYREDSIQTSRYRHMVKDYMGFLPL